MNKIIIEMIAESQVKNSNTKLLVSIRIPFHSISSPTSQFPPNDPIHPKRKTKTKNKVKNESHLGIKLKKQIP